MRKFTYANYTRFFIICRAFLLNHFCFQLKMTLLIGKRQLKVFAIFVLAWLAIFAATVSGQYQIETWTTDNGLPQNTVYSILQTPDGYLWMTTLDGVVRFDGVRFTVFNKNNTKGIESNRFTKMILDGHGNLWIGAETDFITRYYQGNFRTYRIGANEKVSVLQNLFLNSRGELIATTDTDIFQWNGESFTGYTPVAGEKNNHIMLWDKNGTLWYGGGQKLFNVQGKKISEYPLPPVVKENTQINKLLEDNRGRLWIGTQNAGLFLLENEKITKYPFKENFAELSPNIEDGDGNIWAGAVIISPNGTVNRITTAQGLSENSVTTAFQDREGNVWLGTIHRGVNRLSRQSVSFFSRANGIITNEVYPIFQDRSGDIWLGGENLTRYHNGKFEAVSGRENFPKSVTATTQDRAGRLWFGHWGGAYYFEDNQFKNFDKFGRLVAVYSIHEDKAGAMWFATNSGLFRYQNDVMKHYTTADNLAGNDVKVILESKDGTLWVGAYGGLTLIKNNALTSFTKTDGLASNFVRSLYEDSDGVLWIGSYDGGLTRLKDGKFTRYTSNEGLFNDGVFQILEDGRGNFWMSSNRGIYRVAKAQLNDFADGKITRIESVVYSKADGLLETECNGGQQPAGIKTSGGELWFPTQGGVAVIKPDSIKINPLAPPVVIESAKIDNEDAAANDTIKVAPGKNNLEINYTALSFIKPEFVKFKYKLEGLNEDWIEAGDRRTAYYSYVPPGNYTFHVIAANSDGVWNTDGAKIKIFVSPPFYRTWWFWFTSFVFITGAAYFFYRWRVAQLEKARATQEEFSRKLLSSQEQERQRIAAELHDSIGQSLLIIKNRAFLALSDLYEPENVREQLEELSESATGAIEECREISYNLRPYQINRLGLTRTLKAIFRRISEVTEIETVIELDSIDKMFSPEEEINIYRIVQESVNNIIKHSGATEACFFIKCKGAEVDILIQDNGRGFDKNADKSNGNHRGGFGLIGMNERARMLGGSYEIESQPDDGTSIKIKLFISSINERN